MIAHQEYLAHSNKGNNMKNFGIAVLFICVWLGGCTQSQELDKPDLPLATLIYNAQITTMDTAEPDANAMLIRGELIIALGNLANIEMAMGKQELNSVNKIDAHGATILPGFIDSHVHVRELGMDKIKADLVGVKTSDEIVSRLKVFAPNPKPGTWIIGQGWDEGYFASIGYPDRADLDAAFPDNPVKLESLHGFAGFYNGRALQIAGITAATPKPKGGDILHRTDGSPTGVMLTLAQNLVNQHVPTPDHSQLKQAIHAGLMTMARAGVTSVHEAGMTAADVRAFQSLQDEGRLPIRVYGMLNGNDETLMANWFAKGPQDDPQDFLDIRSIKVFYDGSLGSRTALMRAPYSDKPDTANPTERISPAAVTSLAERAAKTGFQIATHAIGDEGNHRTLNIYAKALAQYPDLDHRWRVEHAQVVLPEFYGRMADMNVLASMQSSHAVGDSGWAEDRVGPARIRHAYAWQRVLAAGGRLVINSDLPGEPWHPMQTLYFAVTRKHLDGTPKDGWYTDQALSTYEALKAMTSAGAYSAFQEDKLGALMAGKWADFVILDKNPLTTNPDDLKNIKVLQTWVAGKRIEDE